MFYLSAQLQSERGKTMSRTATDLPSYCAGQIVSKWGAALLHGGRSVK